MYAKMYRVSRPFESFYNVLCTLPLFVRTGFWYTLSRRCRLRESFWQRARIHTSPVCSSAQAFRTRDTHFPLFVCRRRLRGIHTFAFRHRLLERGVHTFRTSPVSSSAQAFRTRHKLSLVCLLAQAPSYSVHAYEQQLIHKLDHDAYTH